MTGFVVTPDEGAEVLPYDQDARTERLRELSERINPPRPARPSVWYGATGPDVEYLQGRLTAMKLYRYSDTEGDEPGLFGRATDLAVRAAQTFHGLESNGVVDDRTWAALG